MNTINKILSLTGAALLTLAIGCDYDPTQPKEIYNMGMLPTDSTAIGCADVAVKAGANATWTCTWGYSTPACDETGHTSDGVYCGNAGAPATMVSYSATAQITTTWEQFFLQSGAPALDKNGQIVHICKINYTKVAYATPAAAMDGSVHDGTAYAGYGVLNKDQKLELYAQSTGVICTATPVAQ